MYRILCRSYDHYMNTLEAIDKDCYRYRVMLPLRLLTDIDLYNKEKSLVSTDYMKTSDFIYYAANNVENFPRLKALLWMLESRGMIGKQYNLVSECDLHEQAKIVEMFARLVYWEETA